LAESQGAGRAHRPGSGLHVKVEIEDTGSGISSSEADKVFNPFFTTKASGTGLGLALTHKIVEDHRGSITFRSVPGTGTTFRVILPAALPADQPPAGSVDV
jgi:two-component system sensor histidine kinase HydH